jgi:hypothetical protein
MKTRPANHVLAQIKDEMTWYRFRDFDYLEFLSGTNRIMTLGNQQWIPLHIFLNDIRPSLIVESNPVPGRDLHIGVVYLAVIYAGVSYGTGIACFPGVVGDNCFVTSV